MSYYSDQRQMKSELAELINVKRQLSDPSKRVVKISDLSIHYGQKYGFGRRTIENALQDFHKSGVIILTKESFEVIE